jgi:hypothetical protein
MEKSWETGINEKIIIINILYCTTELSMNNMNGILTLVACKHSKNEQ